MSVFFKNTCQFNNCPKNFYTLTDLIIHIENDHLDFDQQKIEQLEEEKPEAVPLSYVLKYSRPDDPAPRYTCSSDNLYVNETVIKESEKIPIITETVNSFNNNYLSCSIIDQKGTINGIKSNDLRLKEEVPSHLVGHENYKLFRLDNSHKKPFACNMPGCEKRYKNVNGIKYHYKNHHKINHTSTPKKSLLKHKSVQGHTKSKVERSDLHGIPLLNFKPQTYTQMPNDIVYHNIQNMAMCEDPEGMQNEYIYKFSTLSTSIDFHVSNQVPLPNTSFNYYNVSDLSGDMEDFSGKNSTNFFVPHFNKI